MLGDLGPAAAVLLTVAVVAVVCVARRVILRRRAARRVARWTRELIDPMRLLAELTEPVAPGHVTSQSTAPSIRHIWRTEYMRVDIFDSDVDGAAKRRQAYRRERNVLANATSAHLVGLLGTDDDLTRTAARDELLRRGEHVST